MSFHDRVLDCAWDMCASRGHMVQQIEIEQDRTDIIVRMIGKVAVGGIDLESFTEDMRKQLDIPYVIGLRVEFFHGSVDRPA